MSVLEHSQEFRANDNSLTIADFIVALTVIAPYGYRLDYKEWKNIVWSQEVHNNSMR